MDSFESRRSGQDRRSGGQETDDLPEADVRALPGLVREELATLGGGLPDKVGRLLAAAREVLEEDPETAFSYAQRARSMAPRSSAAREAMGISAYWCGDYATAKRELLAARRMSGLDQLLPLIADCERGLGHPERAVEIGATPGAHALRGDEAAEMLLVVAGARIDLGQAGAAVSLLAAAAERARADQPWALRLTYGYAAALEAAGESDRAATWFARAAELDPNGETDASARCDPIGEPGT